MHGSWGKTRAETGERDVATIHASFPNGRVVATAAVCSPSLFLLSVPRGAPGSDFSPHRTCLAECRRNISDHNQGAVPTVRTVQRQRC